jgi:hypothetical protein
MIDWLLRYLSKRLAAAERIEADSARKRAVYETCVIGGVAEMSDCFVESGMSPEGVARALAECARSRPC